ncbi:hypothetical protein DFA_12151 [Cavenderia fasciculata]|uniref:Uncharacterized protein n=1 Tax=Cavenderia fasciculata TaxID=261658 RepID=F4QC98_CACFS|nr:uncharacterized protein DFA_12151 [Cavenderia fasciculata]EGG14379.1 hypothetical protein DFA_12151 [Cavenderia fasciculata]|eukprot:XP_004353788.1 hypothetical protein DFA_12151 [Cavenderia fasciculata]
MSKQTHNNNNNYKNSKVTPKKTNSPITTKKHNSTTTKPTTTKPNNFKTTKRDIKKEIPKNSKADLKSSDIKKKNQTKKCQVCRKQIGDGTHCQYHKREEALKLQLEQYRKRKDQFGIDLIEKNSQLNGQDQYNPLQPTSGFDAIGLAAKAKTLSKFYDICVASGYLDTIETIMDANSKGKKLADIRKRAIELASLVTTDTKVVRMMDGHGRLVLNFFGEVIKQHKRDRLNKLVIELVDNVKNVTEYHKSFFYTEGRTMINCINADIFQRPVPDADTLVYYNFCGISPSVDSMKARLKVSPATLMVSFSVARGASTKNFGAQLSLAVVHIKDRCFTYLKTEREDFKTMILRVFSKSKKANKLIGILKKDEYIKLDSGLYKNKVGQFINFTPPFINIKYEIKDVPTRVGWDVIVY